MKSYGQQVRDLRVAAGITQRALAEKAGITQTNLCESEKGNRTMTEGEFFRCRATISDLVAERAAAYEEACKAASA